jgi:hypothetical protein
MKLSVVRGLIDRRTPAICGVDCALRARRSPSDLGGPAPALLEHARVVREAARAEDRGSAA